MMLGKFFASRLRVGVFVLPADVDTITETSEMELVELFFMTPVCRPGFRAVELGGENDCAVKFQFGFKANTSPLLDIRPQSLKGTACLGHSVVDLGIDIGNAGECTAAHGTGFLELGETSLWSFWC